jgi:hypothetical protein
MDQGGDAEEQLLPRALGALIAVRRFDSATYLARAVHGATLALSLSAAELPTCEAEWLKGTADPVPSGRARR